MNRVSRQCSANSSPLARRAVWTTVLFLCAVGSSVVAQEISLVCPCELKDNSLTSASVSFGMRNWQETESTTLRVRIIGFYSGRSTYIGQFRIKSPIPADSQLETTEYSSPLYLPSGDEVRFDEIALRLERDSPWKVLDHVWLEGDLVLSALDGESRSGVFFDGEPTVQTSEGSAELDLPAVRNETSSSTIRGLVVDLYASTSSSLATNSSSHTRIGRYEYGVDLAATERTEPVQTSIDIEAFEDGQWLHIAIADTNSRTRHAFEPVVAPSGSSLPTRDFSQAYLDFLQDSDGDGVGDRDEVAVGTDPDDADSVPEDATIDVLAVFSPQAAQLYDVAVPSARTHHILSVANDIYEQSGTDLSFRLVGMTEVYVDESRELGSTVDSSVATDLAERHGADVTLVLRRPQVEKRSYCGFASLNGISSWGGTRGYLAANPIGELATVFIDCRDRVTAHELGHILGLGHSYVTEPTEGTFRWSRGFGVEKSFATVMAYWTAYGERDEVVDLDQFSDPSKDCRDHKCGQPVEDVDGTHAVRSLRATRYQIANVREAIPDTDGDSYVDTVDELPEDPSDWLDTDGDLIGNLTDLDDDNDGYEDTQDAFPLDATEWLDTDGDSVGNNADPDDDNDGVVDIDDAFPLDSTEWLDTDGDLIGNNADTDDDNDSVLDGEDAFPLDPLESSDLDRDGIGDNSDAFTDDPFEWTDSDQDGIGDNADPDIDGDGVDNLLDADPDDPNRSDLLSYRFDGGNELDNIGYSLAYSGDLNADGVADWVIGTPLYDRPNADPESDPQNDAGVVYIVSGATLDDADSADGIADRVIQLDAIAGQSDSWKIVGESASSYAGSHVFGSVDLDSDGYNEILIGSPGTHATDGAVYVVSMADATRIDAADGDEDGTIYLENAADHPNSWKFVGSGIEYAGQWVGASSGLVDGYRLVAIGARFAQKDIDGEDRPVESGTVYLVSVGDFSSADASDGAEDGVIRLASIAGQPRSWRLNHRGGEKWSGIPFALGDIGGDGVLEFAIASPFRESNVGSLYVLSTTDLAAGDEEDGSGDGVIELENIALQDNSWQIDGYQSKHRLGSRVLIADFDDDGSDDLVVSSLVAAHFLSGLDFANADAADGDEDRVISVEHVADQQNSYRLDHNLIAPYRTEAWGSFNRIGDVVGSGYDDFAMNTTAFRREGIFDGLFVFSYEELAALSQEIDPKITHHGLWFRGGSRDFAGFAVTYVGDIDDDGRDDILVSERGADYELRGAGAVFLVMADDLEILAARGYRASGESADSTPVINLRDVAGDFDRDGIPNLTDPDDDNDQIVDRRDAFPLDPSEWVDFDDDGVGNNADLWPNDKYNQDIDFDGVPDSLDDDTDGDGILNEDDVFRYDTDNDGISNPDDPDDDNDGVVDRDDAFPVDPLEWADWDLDGVGDNADDDDDGDGVVDTMDAYPNDPSEWSDDDGDGVADNTDRFPNDSTEWEDFDGDGIGDNADTDDDGDGVSDANDVFPLDPNETLDSDLDGVGDNADAFPNDSSETTDTDSDGVGNNQDDDDDGDGVSDESDLFPLSDSKVDLTSYRLRGETGNSRQPCISSIDDIDGDELGEVLATGQRFHLDNAAIYLISGSELQTMDATDGTSDRLITLSSVTTVSNSWKLVAGDEETLVGCPLATHSSPDDSDEPVLVIGTYGRLSGYFVVDTAYLESLDDEDGVTDRTIYLDSAAKSGASGVWRLDAGRKSHWRHSSVAIASISTNSPDLVVASGVGRTVESSAVTSIFPLDNARSSSDAQSDADTPNTLALPSADEGWAIRGESYTDPVGEILTVGDVDGGRATDLLLGRPLGDPPDSEFDVVYVVAGEQLATATPNSTLSTTDVSAWENSWTVVADQSWSRLTGLASGDVDGDGLDDLVISDRGHVQRIGYRDKANYYAGTIHILAAHDLASIDESDGSKDRVIAVADIYKQRHSWRVIGEPLNQISATTADFDGDGRADLLISSATNAAYLLSATDFEDVDEADGRRDGSLRVPLIALGDNSWKLIASPGTAIWDVQSRVDLDGDAVQDFTVSVVLNGMWRDLVPDPNSTYIISGADLPILDKNDGTADRIVSLEFIVGS